MTVGQSHRVLLVPGRWHCRAELVLAADQYVFGVLGLSVGRFHKVGHSRSQAAVIGVV